MFHRVANSDRAGWGFYHEAEQEIKERMASSKLDFQEISKVIEAMFYPNIGSTQFQAMAEEYALKRLDSESH